MIPLKVIRPIIKADNDFSTIDSKTITGNEHFIEVNSCDEEK